MAAEHVETITVDASTETGLWCGACLLPSRYRVTFSTMGTSGVTVLGVSEGCVAEEDAEDDAP